MNLLELPERLKGPWEHLVIFSFGVDLPFFEGALWRQLSPSCRNRIILADGRQFLEACSGYARGPALRYINQRYIADGIHARAAAHAKVILLTNPEEGRLLVGSGNLNPLGYASEGELFTEYAYSPQDNSLLAAFSAIGEVIEYLCDQNMVGARSAHHLRVLLEETPWMFRSPTDDASPVRHNLRESHMDQFVRALSGDPVEMLTILAPFYDPRLVALKHLIRRLEPKHVRLMLQRERTSIDPLELEDLMQQQDRLEILEVAPEDGRTYLHAKAIIAEQKQRSVILQGSPNISRAALLGTMPTSNLEIANLLTGPAGAFSELLARLTVTRVDDIQGLGLQVRDSGDIDPTDSSRFWLTSAEWRDRHLTIHFKGDLPDLEDAVIQYGEYGFSAKVVQMGERSLSLEIGDEEVNYLALGLPIFINLSNGCSSNPIFPANLAQLDRELEVRETTADLDKIGVLDLEDEELERLLMALEESLVFDAQSLWRLVGRGGSDSTSDEQSEGEFIDYSEIDYDRLRKHPKIQQYLRRGSGVPNGGVQTRLQVILSSISRHFRGLVLGQQPVGMAGAAEALESEMDRTLETEEEAETAQIERERRRLDSSIRIRNLLKRFINRYLSGLESREFQELAGYEVMVQNYTIFVHILWRLFFNDWLDPADVASFVLRTFELFWGSQSERGFIEKLSEEEKVLALEGLQDAGATKYLIALLFASDQAAQDEDDLELRMALRDFWRSIVVASNVEITRNDLAGAWVLIGDLRISQTSRRERPCWPRSLV